MLSSHLAWNVRLSAYGDHQALRDQISRSMVGWRFCYVRLCRDEMIESNLHGSGKGMLSRKNLQ